MSITTNHNAPDNELLLQISDRFDYSLHNDFVDSYREHSSLGASFRLDLSETTYIDSSALGMILLLKEHARRNMGELIIDKPSRIVSKVLETAQFKYLMTINH